MSCNATSGPKHTDQRCKTVFCNIERRGSVPVVVSTSACHAAGRGSIPAPGVLLVTSKNLALYIRDCVSLCLSDETLKSRASIQCLCQGK